MRTLGKHRHFLAAEGWLPTEIAVLRNTWALTSDVSASADNREVE